ncbi:MAG: hypothetical protein DRJ46_00025 [Thermoprotei archaeon]|nr:MAG: hypothetical protein DRJ46_00025 [Thermoprotei archaeon]
MTKYILPLLVINYVSKSYSQKTSEELSSWIFASACILALTAELIMLVLTTFCGLQPTILNGFSSFSDIYGSRSEYMASYIFSSHSPRGNLAGIFEIAVKNGNERIWLITQGYETLMLNKGGNVSYCIRKVNPYCPCKTETQWTCFPGTPPDVAIQDFRIYLEKFSQAMTYVEDRQILGERCSCWRAELFKGGAVEKAYVCLTSDGIPLQVIIETYRSGVLESVLKWRARTLSRQVSELIFGTVGG